MYRSNQSNQESVTAEPVTAPDANASAKAAFYLSEAQPGQRLRLERVEAGRRLQARLISMGLPLGSEVTVLHNRAGGIVVATGSGRFALGKGMANKLIVRSLL